MTNIASASVLNVPGAPARPILKWAGGKTQLLDQYEPYFPVQFQRYFEPFVGSAAVFFHLHNQGRIQHGAVLSDSNRDLMDCYCGVRDYLHEVVELLKVHKASHSREHYYAVRALDPESLDLPARAARVLYLNKTCFNGLYRVNRSGKFNVPMGRYANPNILDEERLARASAALRGIDLTVQDFACVVERAQAGDFVYFDPPYHPVSSTSNYTSYTADSFDEPEQERLASVVEVLADNGVNVMVSNSDTTFIRTLYSHYYIHEVQAARAINSDPTKRGRITELVITTYPPAKVAQAGRASSLGK